MQITDMYFLVHTDSHFLLIVIDSVFDHLQVKYEKKNSYNFLKNRT